MQASQYGDIKITVEKIPNTVKLEEPFDITLAITNIRSVTFYIFSYSFETF